ncbi:hypothetical protein [Acinetobacter sp.]|uniref:hypothetical protein n=1 Tax=Acinetobacter sp. TaxID=472 RepID=UPI003AFFFA17
MYLSKLKITTSSGISIRDITFHKGLNIILGERCVDSGSTNSIGKTTLLRAIDFCLGGDEKTFYQDSESKAIDKNVFNFFYYVQPSFKLELKKNLNVSFSRKVNFERKIIGVVVKNVQKLKVLHYVDDLEVSSDQYIEKLKNELFNYDNHKPGFRQLISKFIRKDDQQINFILRFLHQATSDLDYEVMHFFLFGYSKPLEIEKKYQIEKDIKLQKADIKAFDRIKPAGLDQVIVLTQNELNDLIKKRDDFRIDEKYNSEEDKLNFIQNKIKKIDEDIGYFDFEISALNERRTLLSKKEFTENVDAITLLYDEAKIYNLELKRKFAETVNFHNTMLINELVYIENRIVELIHDKENAIIQRADLAKEYSVVLEKLAQYGSLAEYTKLNNQINELQSELSKSLVLNQKAIELNTTLFDLNIELENLNLKIGKNIHSIQDNITIFNKYFAEYCKELFKQTFYLSAEPNDKGIYKFKISSLNQNLGSGRKLSLVVAFDLAYTAFIQDSEVNLPYPRFSTQDKIEIIDIQELYKLSQLANESNGQLIFPIINDKFTGLTDFNDNVILRVSKTDRFFRIEEFLQASLYET